MSTETLSLALSEWQVREITSTLEYAWPEEGCGLLIGRSLAGGRVEVDEIVASSNVAEDAKRAFEVDPALIFQYHKRLRGTARQVVGVFHSHPSGPAEPSPRDLARVYEPHLIWLIAALDGGVVGELKAFCLAPDGGHFEAVGLEVLPNAAPRGAKA